MRVFLVGKDVQKPDLPRVIRSRVCNGDSPVLVIARDLPAAADALGIAKSLSCAAYYNSVETWTGYYVLNGKRTVPAYWVTRWREQRVIHRFMRVITHSDTSREYLCGVYGLRPESTGVLYATMPTSGGEHKTGVLRKHVSLLRPSDRVIVCSGGLMSAKRRGLENLVDCFLHVRSDYHLVFLGGGPSQGDLQERVAHNNLQGRVHFLSMMPMNSYFGHLTDADIGIDLRTPELLNYDLCCSIRVVDYITCGLPVIASETRCFRDLEKRHSFIKCVPGVLSPVAQGAFIEKTADYFFDNMARITDSIHGDFEKTFSFGAALAKLRRWLIQDGLLRHQVPTSWPV